MANEASTVDYRALLEEERSSLVRQLQEIGFGENGTLTYDANFADSSQVTAERGEAEALCGPASGVARARRAALLKFDQGTYGICERCGKPISARPPRGPAGNRLLHRLRLGSTLTAGARWRSLRSNQQLPIYIIIAAVAVGVIVLAIRHHVLNEQTLIFYRCLHSGGHPPRGEPWSRGSVVWRRHRQAGPSAHFEPPETHRPVRLDRAARDTGGDDGDTIFGWAKPVPVRSTASAIRGTRRCSWAGRPGDQHHPGIDRWHSPFHLLVAHAWTPVPVCTFSGCFYDPSTFPLIEQIVFEFGVINILLAAFNLIPIPPLDGSALVERLLPTSALPAYYRMRMGFIVLVVLLVLFDQGLLGRIFGDVENWYFNRIF